jgi:hypothetical protein
MTKFSEALLSEEDAEFVVALGGNLLTPALPISNSTESQFPFSVRSPQNISEPELRHRKRGEEAEEWKGHVAW